nr:tRNA pseudouridine(55) synthase TruB [Propionicimonas sp.]
MTDASGLVVVDKPAGWTSHQVVGRCRRLLGTKKVGHAGTLDPMATGVLLVGVNRATRLLGHLAGHDKTYTATIRLGQSTVTDDAEGEVVEAPGAAGVSEAEVRAAIPAFVGRISQVPSSVSAIKVAGKRAYAMVRAGEEVELRPREVTVSRFDVVNVRAATAQPLVGPTAQPLVGPTAQPLVGPTAQPLVEPVETPVLDLDVEIDCSSGTYIRALARDLGRALGCGGHLTALRRTRVGGFDLSLVGLDAAGLAGDAPPELIGLAEVARRAFPVVEVTPAQATDVGFGRSLDLPVPADPTALLAGDQLLALYRPAGDGRSAPVAVLV